MALSHRGAIRMSNLLPAVVGLDNGLNLQTAKIVAPPGSVLDSMNYEQVDFQGLKRIDGFARYDGSAMGILNDYYVVTGTDLGVSFNVLDLVFTAQQVDQIDADHLFGVVVAAIADSGNWTLHIAVINELNIPELFHTVRSATDSLQINEGMWGKDSWSAYSNEEAVQFHYDNLLLYNNRLRDRTELLPGAIAGLHWFRDRLYAVADVIALALDHSSVYDADIHPNDIITAVDTGATAKVLDVVKYRDRFEQIIWVIFIKSMTWSDWPVGSVLTNGGSVQYAQIKTVEDFPVDLEVATFWESRSERQVLAEDPEGGPYDFGWRMIDQGWSVPFEDGVSLFGSLPSLNQNIDGLGVQGPTNITGNNGRPLALTQKVSITGLPVQVSGWKSSQTPDSYNLITDNVAELDSDYIYGDAYVSWVGLTGEVIAPGLTTTELTEYPATNTVVIDNI